MGPFLQNLDLDGLIASDMDSFDKPHPHDSSRTFMKDIENLMDNVQNKMVNSSNPKQVDRIQVMKQIYQIRDEYLAKDIMNDQTGKLY